MILPFEQWINSQEIYQEAKSLAREAIICYKASAYRAALLFSYLSFQTIIKDRLMRSQKPKNFAQKLWDSLQKDLRDDEKWDSIVYDALKRKQPQVFVLNDNIRNQIDYWKDRRNDCAHSKNNQINYAHVEAFWQFLESNLPKLVVNGSKDALVNRILRHFDPSFTSIGSNFDDIIRIIPHAVDENEILDFYHKIHNELRSQDRYYPHDGYKVDFWNALFQLGDIFVKKLVLFLKTDDIYIRELLMNILEMNPNKMNYFHDDPQFIRNLWYSKLFCTTSQNLGIYTTLLRNNLIPQSEINEANLHIIKKLGNEVPDELDYVILLENGFFNVFKKFIFEEGNINDYYCANGKSELILFYLERFELDDVVVKAIANCFIMEKHPWILRKGLYRFFKKFAAKAEIFVKICETNHWQIPEGFYLK